MKNPALQQITLTLLAFTLPLLARAADVTMSSSDGFGTSSLESAGKWNNGQPPNSTNDYFSGPYFIRTPTGSGGVVFAGHSLTLQNVIGGGQGIPQRSVLYKGGGGETIVINNLTNAAGGVLNNGGSGVVTVKPVFSGNLWTIAGNSTILSDQDSTIIGYPLAGSDGVILTNTSGQARTIYYTNSLAGFTGKFDIVSSVTVALTNSASNFGNPSTPTPDQFTINSGCTLLDVVGISFTNPNGGFTLIGTPTISASSTTVIGEPITDLTNGVSSVSSLTKAGSGTLILNNPNNTYSGGTIISAGTLRMGVANALTNNGPVAVNGGVFDLNTFSTTIGALNGSGGSVDTLAGGTPTLTVGNGDANGTFAGTIQNTAGTLSLTKVGAGTETLTAGYTYSGQTVVAGGALILATTGSLPATAGDLTVSNGAVLAVNASTGTALPANNLTLGPNATLNLSAAGTANGINARGNLTLGDNVTNNFNYGNVSANPAAAAINVAGSLSAPGANIVINVNAFGLRAGQFPLIKYAGTPLAGIANFTLGSIPPGVVATLVNNSGNHSIDLNVVSAPNELAWNGVNGATWDTTTANWSNLITGAIAAYQEHGGIAGDIVTFDDTLTNDFVHPQPTNVNLTVTIHPFPVTANSTLPYSIAGAGALIGSSGNTGLPYLAKNNTGSFTLLTSNSFTGGISINAGMLIITNDSALGASANVVTLNGGTLEVSGNTANSTRPFNVPTASSIGVATNVVAQLGGTLTGAGGLTKTDTGTLVLAGSNLITGALAVNQGTLTTLGANVLSSVPLIGNAAGLNGILNIAGGSFQANNNGGQTFSPSLTIGNTAGSAGELLMNSGTLTVRRELAIGPTGYGAFNQSGGAVAIDGFLACGGSTGGGVFNQTGGTVSLNGAPVTIGYNAAGTYGEMNLGGNAVFQMIGAGNGVWPGELGNGILNVSGNAALTITNDGISLSKGNGATVGVGTVNLDGGTITVNFITNGPVAGTFNFNGGTLKANAGGTFTKGTANTRFFDYAGGAVIDDGGNAITFTQPLLAVTNGSGIASIPLINGGGSGYIAPPIVTVIDANGLGSNATAIAQIDPVQGTVTNIIVTCPGSGFDPAGSFIQVGFIGGGANVTAPVVNYFDPVFAPSASGGLTKKGSGSLTMTGVNTFTGPITNNAGTLTLNSASTYSGAVVVNAGVVSLTTASILTGPTTVSNGATFAVNQIGSGTNVMGDLTLAGGAALPGATVGMGVAAGNNPAVPFINCGTLTLLGTNSISLNGAIAVGKIPLVKYAALGGSGTIANLILPQGAAGYISNSVSSSTLYVVVTSTGPGLVWTGTNSAAANVWDIAATTNWLLFSTPTSYHQPIVPGDAVTFDDTGSGTVILNVNAGPASVVITNNSKSYTFRGRGTIIGPGGLTKLGTNTVFMNLTNNSYASATVISNGALQLGDAAALPVGGDVNIGPSGTLELAGWPATFGELTGSGVIDNNSGLNPILTVGTSVGGTWNGTIQDHGGGGVAIHKVGSGTWIVGGQNYLNDGQPFTDRSQLTSGTVIITNGGLLEVSALELRIANGVGQSCTVVVDGGTLAVSNNALSVGYGAGSGGGTLIVNHGTVFHGGTATGGFALMANSIDVGAQGGSGTLIVNGGQVLNNQVLFLGDGSGANGKLYLNGGVLQSSALLANGSPNSSIAYLNGGTLQASTNSANFLQNATFNVMSNGFTLDDNGWAVNITAVLNPGDNFNGGLTKQGSGTVYLDAVNTYTGLTVVTNGTLAGVGSVASNVLVVANGKLGAGDAATNGIFTVGGNLTLQAGTALRINKTGGVVTNDQVVVGGNIAFGGTLTINNITGDGTALVPGDSFQLFSKGGSGNFTSVTGPGATYSFNPATGVLTVNSIVVGPGTFSNPTGITGFRLNGGNVVITGTNGQAGDAYYLLQSTNVSLPLSRWSVVATNVLGANGGYTFVGTNAVTAGGGQQFYILSNTNNH